MTTTTAQPAAAETFICINPTCGVENPPVLISREDGTRVCFSCGTPQRDAVVLVASDNPMRAIDRCDRCPSRAYGRVSMPDALEPLLFCGHHLSLYMPRLRKVARQIEDFRPALVKEETGAAV